MASPRFQLFRLTSTGVTWRFMASNNRELARAGLPAPDELGARELVLELQRRLGQASSVSLQDGTGRWRWDLRFDGATVAVSSRVYFRRVECDATRAQFLLCARAAPISRGTRLGHSPHAEVIARTPVGLPPAR